jgi:hypothetical protein
VQSVVTSFLVLQEGAELYEGTRDCFGEIIMIIAQVTSFASFLRSILGQCLLEMCTC